MQRDQKVGLALGVLLIGTVAAFFFRNETTTGIAIPQLERAAEVDREIAEKRLTPYFSEIETDDTPNRTRTKPASDSRDVSDTRTGERKLPSWDELQTDRDDPFANDSTRKDVPAPAPDPIRFETVASETHGGPPPDNHQPWNPVDDVAAKSDLLPAVKVHEVQRGETLSSIAAKHLGSPVRFQEIFEANRDQLRDANDLKIGMKLRIPDARVKPTAAKPVSPPAPTGRVKKMAEPTAAPPAGNEAEDEENVFAESMETTTDEGEVVAAPESALPTASEPPKVRFSPAKRRSPR